MKDEELILDNYTFIGNNRTKLHINAKKGSGGVAFLLSNELLKDFNVSVIDNDNEGILWIKLKCKNNFYENIIACVCYLPPENSTRRVDGQKFYENLLCQIC
jgi:hypothetical protein